MPAFDKCHDQVVRALQKAGWQVDSEPQRLSYEKRVVFIDVRAMRPRNGSNQQILLAEIKCFPDRDSTTREIYIAVGQYIIYRTMLTARNIAIPLYLAVPEDVYKDIFDSTIRRAINDNNIRLVIVNLELETITQWIE